MAVLQGGGREFVAGFVAKSRDSARLHLDMVDGRVGQVDLMRFLAFATITLIHVGWVETKDLNVHSGLMLLLRYSLPFFFMTSGYFAERHAHESAAHLRRVVLRLAGLFVFWELVYNAIHFFVHDFGYRAMPTTPREILVYAAITLNGGGVAFHLWFLPWLAVSLTVFTVLRRFGWRAVWIGVVLLYGLGLAVGPYTEFPGFSDRVARIFPEPAGFTARNGPFFGPMFIAFGAWFAADGDRVARVPRGVPVAAFLLGVALFALEASFISRHGIKTISGFNFLVGSLIFAPALFLIVMRWSLGPIGRATARLGRYALGMYCVHAFFTLVYIQSHPARLRLEAPIVDTFVTAALVIAASVVSTLLLARISVLRRFVA